MFSELINSFFNNNTNQKATSEILNHIEKGKNEKEFKEGMDRVWGMKTSSNQLEEAPDEQEMLDKFYSKHNDKFKENRQRENRFINLYPYLKIAAVLVILLGIGTFYYSNFLTNDGYSISENSDTEIIEKSVPFGAKLTLTLSDGSTIKLNSGSKVSYPKSFGEDKREIKLEGEAFFEVQRDEKRPFIVHSKDLQTIVLGTSFNIKAYQEADDISVAVVTGKVKVKRSIHNNEQETVLIPSEMAIIGSEEIEKINFSEKKVVSWKDNIIHFEDASFEDVTKILERWYGVTFIMNKPNGVQGKFEGTFHNLSLQEVLEGLNYTTKFDFKIEEESVLIY